MTKGLPYPTPYEVERAGIIRCLRSWVKPASYRHASVYGVPSIAGTVLAHDGVLAIVERADKQLFIVHKENLVYTDTAAVGCKTSPATPSPRRSSKRKLVEQEYY